MAKKIVTVAGASGVVGRHIIKYALDHGYDIRVLSRTEKPSQGNIQYFKWDPENFLEVDLDNIVKAMEGSDIVINLSGASISEGRLNNKLESRILNSRLNSTEILIQAYLKCKKPPKIWGQASALGYYGDTGELEVTEESAPGNLFFSSVCSQWENKLTPLNNLKKPPKIIIGRFGMVLAKDAPVWQKKISPLIKSGLGGPIGSGKQWFPWIDADDVAGAFFYLFYYKESGGIYNFTSPEPVRQADFFKKAASILHRPSFFRAPKFLVRVVIGKVADIALFASCKAIPKKLIRSGYKFQYPELEKEMHHIIGK